MKHTFLDIIIDQRKLSTHIYFLLFSLLVIGLTITLKGDFNSWENYISALVLIFLQMEVFIYLGRRIFKGYRPIATPREITRGILQRFLLFFIACLLMAFILIISLHYIESIVRFHRTSGILKDFFHNEFGGWFKTTFSGLSIGAIIFVYLLWQEAIHREQELREENLVFQNETLKNQVNPHFLFNSLNTLSSLVAGNSDVADRFISKLASTYRYILENGHKDKVPLDLELEYIRDYFELHKVRDEGKIILSIDIQDAGQYEIIPVSLQILIENAIKHNKATREDPLVIEVNIEDQYVVVKNNLQKMATQLKSTGLGIKNLTARVKLASGKPVVVEGTDNYFIVKVPLL